MESLNILEWLKTGWGLAVVISGLIGTFFTIRGNIKKLFDEIKKPVTDLKDQITDIDAKLDNQGNDFEHKLNAQTEAVNQVIETEVHRVESAIRDLKSHNEIEDNAMLAILKSDMLKNCEKYIKSG